MTPGQPWPRPAAGTRPGLAGLASLLLHAACLGAVIGLLNRAPTAEPVPERGVEIVWDQEAAEAVSEAEAPAPPAAPPEASAPPLPEAAAAPPPPPVAPPLALAPPPPAPPLNPPQLELPMPDLRVASPPEPPPQPQRQMAAATPPPAPPPPPEPQPLETRPLETRLPEPLPPEPLPPEPPRPRPRPARAPQRIPPPAEANRAGEEAAAQSTAGIGRATGAVVPPGPDTRYGNAAPSYPEAARLRGEQGTVGLELGVAVDGRVTAVTVARSSGSPMLDAAARRAVQEWRFRPAMRDGEAVPGTIRTSMHFRLQ